MGSVIDRRLRLLRGGGFSPLSLNPALWLDAADASTLFDATTGGSPVAAGGGIARWEDKSGFARHVTQVTAGQRPLRQAAARNGKDVARFDGINDYLVSASFTPLAQPSTAFLAWQSNVTGQDNKALDGVGTDRNSVFLQSTSSYRSYAGGSVIGGTADTGWHVVTATFAGAASVLRVDGVMVGSGDVGTQAMGRYTVGVDQGLALQFWNGDLGDVLFYNRLLDGADVAAVENYLRTKWGTP